MINVLLSDFYDEVARNEPAESLFIFENPNSAKTDWWGRGDLNPGPRVSPGQSSKGSSPNQQTRSSSHLWSPR